VTSSVNQKAGFDIPLSGPDITEAEIAAVTAVLRTPRLSLGQQLVEFESELARYVGSAHCVALSSGTAGLHLALLVAGIGPDDEVLVPSFAFIAVANVVRYVGALPVFVDIDARTLNLAPAAVEAAITPRTRAIIVVHTFGVPASLDELLHIGRRHHLRIIEDACESLGGEYQRRKLGSCGDVGVFGFYPNKQITTGEGGALVTDDAAMAARARSLCNQGRGNSGDWFEHQEIGYNYRISELNCALGRVQLSRIDEILAKREAVAQMYAAQLGGETRLELPMTVAADGKISWFVYVVRLTQNADTNMRDGVARFLTERGIGCGRYFAPIHQQPAYRDVPHRCMDLQVTESVASRTLALPFFSALTSAQVDAVCEALQESLDILAL
jgi:dTDP-4-amino-4,6-dideoxygalactose transaminase